jgi:lysophospholipase L1-like esterase
MAKKYFDNMPASDVKALKSSLKIIDAGNTDFVSLGDSVTYGAGSTDDSNGYAYLINQIVGFKSFTNLAISGSRCMPTVGHAKISDQVSLIPAGSDLITVNIGVNDYTDGHIIGDIESVLLKTYASLDETLSFVEAYRYNLETIKINFPDAKIFAITPSQNIYAGAYDIKLYVNAIIAVANYLSIPVIDVHNNSGLWKGGDMFADGLHPNDRGHQALADYVLRKIISGGGEVVKNAIHPFVTNGAKVSVGTPYIYAPLTTSKPSEDDGGASPTGALLVAAVGDTGVCLSAGVSYSSSSSYIQSRRLDSTAKYSLALNPSGGNVGIGYNTDADLAKGKLAVNGDVYISGSAKIISVLEYADNAAAIAAGLTIGSIYRTGDFLKIVH